MAEFSFNLKIVKEGIKKADFLKDADEDKKTKLSSIFEMFDKVETDKDILDEKEQMNLISYLKNISGDNTKITDDEYNASDKKDGLKDFVEKYNTLNQDGTDVTVDEETGTITYESAEYSAKKDSSVTKLADIELKEKPQMTKQSLDSNWKNKRTIAGYITSDKDGYKDIKDNTKYKTALQVFNKLLSLQGVQIKDADKKQELYNEFVRCNPSMFTTDGVVHSNADWSKLDFPDLTHIGSTYGATKSDGTEIKEEDNLKPFENPLTSLTDIQKKNLANINVDTLNTKNTANANKKVKDNETGLTYVYDEDGYVVHIEDSDGNAITRSISRDDNNKVRTFSFVTERNDEDKIVKEIFYNSDKTISGYETTEYQTDGTYTSTLYKGNTDKIDSVQEYHKNGKIKKITLYQADGKKIKQVNEYDSEGKLTKKTFYDEDGNVDNVIEANGKSGSYITGYQVAKDLIGRTNDYEQKRVTELIDGLDADNVVNFLEGYEANKRGGDSIAEQIMTESGWDETEQKRLVLKITDTLLERAVDANAITDTKKTDYSNQINEKLESKKYSEVDNLISEIKNKIAEKENA